MTSANFFSCFSPPTALSLAAESQRINIMNRAEVAPNENCGTIKFISPNNCDFHLGRVTRASALFIALSCEAWKVQLLGIPNLMLFHFSPLESFTKQISLIKLLRRTRLIARLHTRTRTRELNCSISRATLVQIMNDKVIERLSAADMIRNLIFSDWTRFPLLWEPRKKFFHSINESEKSFSRLLIKQINLIKKI